MKERGMLFGAPMVRAVLDGRKTQTRRGVAWRDVETGLNLGFSGLSAHETPNGWVLSSPTRSSHEDRCTPTPSPHGKPGDRIWAKETWRYHGAMGSATPGIMSEIYISYAADGVRRTVVPNGEALPLPKQPPQRDGEIYSFRDASAEEIDRIINGEKTYTDRLNAWWRRDIPSILMYRWASRITLEITNVRVERLQAISEADAIAEGVRRFDDIPIGPLESGLRYLTPSRFSAFNPTSTDECQPTAREAFGYLWNSIHGAASWDANPWVWVYEFKRATV